MARQNDVLLYGCISSDPLITKTESGEYKEGKFYIAVMRSSRNSGETWNAGKIMYDWPIVLSNDPEMIAQMEKLRIYDMVEIRGKFVTRKARKQVFCPHCGAAVRLPANIDFVMPLVLKKRTTPGQEPTKAAGFRDLADNRELSNSIIIVGGVCRDVNYFKGETLETSVYQIATDRRVFVKGDSPDAKTDYPIIRSFGKQAYSDHLCLVTGSLVLINGYLHSKRFRRKSMCTECNQGFEWEDETTEIIPYSEEYLANYIDPGQKESEIEEEDAEEGQKLADMI